MSDAGPTQPSLRAPKWPRQRLRRPALLPAFPLTCHASGRLFIAALLSPVLLIATTAAPGFGQDAPARQRAVAAFGIETIGAAAGSAVGFSAVVLLTDHDACGDNLSCVLGNAALALTGATVGSAVGALALGSAFDTRPHGAGVIVGALAGAAAAVGMDHLLREEIGLNMSDGATIIVIALTQGVVTALGSRLGVALRRR
ncbi:hypothetical protein BH23GEM9_BH23GEM9_36330 [soil metagenome]